MGGSTLNTYLSRPSQERNGSTRIDCSTCSITRRHNGRRQDFSLLKYYENGRIDRSPYAEREDLT